MKFKLLSTILFCSIVGVSGLIFNSNNTTVATKKIVISADYPKYDNLDALIDKADTVVDGKIINTTYTELNISQEITSNDEFLNTGGEFDNSKFVYTVFDVEVKNVYKGNIAENDIIQIKQPGGIIGNTEYVFEDGIDTNLQEENSYIFFIETYANSPASLLNPIQGSYELEVNPRSRSQIDYYNIKSNLNNNINFDIQDLINNDKIKISQNKLFKFSLDELFEE